MVRCASVDGRRQIICMVLVSAVVASLTVRVRGGGTPPYEKLYIFHKLSVRAWKHGVLGGEIPTY